MNISNVNCCGCGACSEICPKNCITIVQNGEGFFQASVNFDQCIDCGKCLISCPINSPDNSNATLSAYLGYHNDDFIKINSTSGGIFYEIAKRFLLNNGIVYGAAYLNGFSVQHIRISNIDDLSKLQGSKYAQSKLDSSYNALKEDLKSGKYVLFSGTPCQISAVKNLFYEKYKNQLITIDLICHGVPSSKLFSDYIKYLEKKKKSKIIKYQFRCKENSTELMSYNTKITYNHKGKTIDSIIDGNEDPFVLRFLSNCLQLNSCYDCPFTKENRCSDITLGDFWGVEKTFPEKINIAQKGISLVLANTKVGEFMLKKLTNVYLEKIHKSDYIDYNKHLTSPSNKNPERDVLYSYYSKYGFSKMFYNNYFLPYKFKEYILKRKILRCLKWLKK